MANYKYLNIGFCLLFVVCFLGFSSPAGAVPQYLNYQGVLRDNSGALISGSKDMTFGLYDVADGGTALWTMTSSEVSVSNGLYGISLGPLGYTELGSGRRWLETAVGGEVLSPRLEIQSVAYAVAADQAASAGYAALSGTASNAASAANADAVDNLHFLMGTGQISSGAVFTDISNATITSGSRIFLSVGNNVAGQNTNGGIRISFINAGNGFRVSTMNGAAASADIPFAYLIVN